VLVHLGGAKHAWVIFTKLPLAPGPSPQGQATAAHRLAVARWRMEGGRRERRSVQRQERRMNLELKTIKIVLDKKNYDGQHYDLKSCIKIVYIS